MNRRIIFGLAKSNFPIQLYENIISSSGVYNFLGILQKNTTRNNGINKDSIIENAPQRIKFNLFYLEILKALFKGRVLINYTFCGPHFSNFGHFLLESLSRVDSSTKKIVFQTMDSSIQHQKVLPYQVELIKLFSGRTPRIKLLTNKSYLLVNCKITNIEIDFPLKINKKVLTKYSNIANKIKSMETHKYVFLSRSKLPTSQLRIPLKQNLELEKLFKEFNFQIIHPELLSIIDQIALIKKVKILAGNQGSGLHLSIFADEKCSVIELGDSFQKVTPNTMQKIICEVKNQNFIYLSYANSEFDMSEVRITLQKLVGSGG